MFIADKTSPSDWLLQKVYDQEQKGNKVTSRVVCLVFSGPFAFLSVLYNGSCLIRKTPFVAIKIMAGQSQRLESMQLKMHAYKVAAFIVVFFFCPIAGFRDPRGTVRLLADNKVIMLKSQRRSRFSLIDESRFKKPSQVFTKRVIGSMVVTLAKKPSHSTLLSKFSSGQNPARQAYHKYQVVKALKILNVSSLPTAQAVELKPSLFGLQESVKPPAVVKPTLSDADFEISDTDFEILDKALSQIQTPAAAPTASTGFAGSFVNWLFSTSLKNPVAKKIILPECVSNYQLPPAAEDGDSDSQSNGKPAYLISMQKATETERYKTLLEDVQVRYKAYLGYKEEFAKYEVERAKLAPVLQSAANTPNLAPAMPKEESAIPVPPPPPLSSELPPPPPPPPPASLRSPPVSPTKPGIAKPIKKKSKKNIVQPVQTSENTELHSKHGSSFYHMQEEKAEIFKIIFGKDFADKSKVAEREDNFGLFVQQFIRLATRKIEEAKRAKANRSSVAKPTSQKTKTEERYAGLDREDTLQASGLDNKVKEFKRALEQIKKQVESRNDIMTSSNALVEKKKVSANQYAALIQNSDVNQIHYSQTDSDSLKVCLANIASLEVEIDKLKELIAKIDAEIDKNLSGMSDILAALQKKKIIESKEGLKLSTENIEELYEEIAQKVEANLVQMKQEAPQKAQMVKERRISKSQQPFIVKGESLIQGETKVIVDTSKSIVLVVKDDYGA